MNFTYHREEPSGKRVYHLEIDEMDLILCNLNWFDRAVIADCDSEGATIADKLLALELITRRIEEAHRLKEIYAKIDKVEEP
jgi:hypothetical protein